MANANLKKSISPKEMEMLEEINIFDSYDSRDPSLLLQKSNTDLVNKLIQKPTGDLLDRGVELYDENVPLLAKLAIGFTPEGLAIDAAEVAKYGRDAYRDFGSGDLGSGAINLGITGLSALGFIPFAGDLVKAGGKELLKRAPQSFIDMRATKLVPTKGKPTFEGPVRNMHPRLEKGLDKQMNKHQIYFQSIDEMFETAKSANKPFQKEIDDVAMDLNLRTAGSPGEVITDPDLLKNIDPLTGFDIRTNNPPGTVKLLKSMTRKAKDKYFGDFTQVTDPMRTRVIANTTQEADEFARLIANRYPTKDSGNQLSGLGLRDRKLNIQYTSPNGEKIIAEISVVPQAMKDATELTHPLYNQWRVLDAQYKNVKDIPPQVLDQLDELKQLQLDIFADAEKSLDSSWLSNEIIKKFAKGGAVAYEGY